MKKYDIKISIIIPIYNAEKYLNQCIDSLLNQTLKEIEIICVDDCSTDRSLDIIINYAKNDARVSIIKNESNLNAGESRNIGLKLAKGEYIHFLDADDYMLLNAYEVIYQKAKQNYVDFIKFKAYAVDDKTGTMIANKWYSLDTLNKSDFNKITNFYETPDKFIKISVVPWAGVYKRSFLHSNNIYFNKLKCVNDRSFYNEVIIKANYVMFIEDYLIYHRINVNGSLISARAKNFDCHFKSYNIIKKQCDFLPQKEKHCILEGELQDMFVWYKKYQREHILEEEIYQQTKSFIDQLDVSVFGEQLKYCRWYKDYLSIKSGKMSVEGALPAKNKLYQCLWYSKEYGFKYTLVLVIKKIHRKIGDRTILSKRQK